ncbi:MAG: hypothetical protein ACOX8W_00865 [bacterium]|jgi:hypothetical protein
MAFFRTKESEDLKTLLRMLHYYVDRRLEGQINVTGRAAIVGLIQTCINNGDKQFIPSAWEAYYPIFERFQEKHLPASQRSPESIHRAIDKTFKKAYGRTFFDRDIYQFYITAGGQEVKEIYEKITNHERSVSNERT